MVITAVLAAAVAVVDAYRLKLMKTKMSQVSSRCVGRYAVLAEDLGDMTFDDLMKQDVHDLIGKARDENKAIMGDFIRQRLQEFYPALSRHNQEDSKDAHLSHLTVDFFIAHMGDDGSLDMSGRVTSARFAGRNSRSMSTSELVDQLKDIPVKSLQSVKTLNLSKCNLLDRDMELIFDAVRLLPNCSIVDLSWNRLSGVDNTNFNITLIELLTIEHIDFVVVAGNPIATVDRKDLYQNMDLELLKKIVWIPKDWIGPGTWKRVIGDVLDPNLQERIEAIERSHNCFYSHSHSQQDK